ncbi:hypothetical protein K040078D81_30190 [Blautia hominis]|uniref:Alternate signal-mediated exported protein, CPF_0494 family n=1 Tax=Blautia hominis TaxID=2025493 RepID=A0ABQ0BBT3_9FIRM
MSEVRKREMRREAAALLLLILLLTAAGLAVGVGSAYFSDQDARSNRIKPGDSNLEITEEFHPPDELKPGEIIAKSVQITNKGKSSCFVRCRLLLDDEGILPYLNLGLDTENWVKAEDGYYYYKSALEIGEITTELLKQIEVAKDAPEELLKRGFSLNVYAESYQQGQFLKEVWQEAWKHFEKNQKAWNEEGSV